MAKSLKEGAGAMHSWVKREVEAGETCIQIEGRLTAAPADIVEQEYETWKETWDKLKKWQSSPWREKARVKGAVRTHQPYPT